MDRATASASKHHRPQNGPRRVASRVNLAGLFKARKNVRKTFLVALATPELLPSPSLTRPERNIRRFYSRSNAGLNSVGRYVETSGLTVSSASLRQLLNSQFFHNNSLNMFHELIEVLVTGNRRSLNRQ